MLNSTFLESNLWMESSLNFVTGPFGVRRYIPDVDQPTMLVYSELPDTEAIERGFGPVRDAIKGNRKVCQLFLYFMSACFISNLFKINATAYGRKISKFLIYISI